MKKLVDQGADDHPDGAERPPVHWTVAVMDDCDDCEDLRIELVVEERGRPGEGVIAHLAPDTARRLRHVLANALREIGEAAD